MLYTAEAASAIATPSYAITAPCAVGTWRRPASGFVPGGTIPLSQIQVGETTYRLRTPVHGVFVPSEGVQWEFWVDGFGPRFVGVGPEPESAFRNWRDQVHEAFQDLYRKRPFERTGDDAEKWKVLEALIDVVGYQNETPVLVRQIGRISQARSSDMRQITWVDESKENRVDLALMPADFARFKPGQWFEAIVERDPLTWQMRRVRYAQRISSVRKLSEVAADEYWKKLETTETLPESTRNWTVR